MVASGGRDVAQTRMRCQGREAVGPAAATNVSGTEGQDASPEKAKWRAAQNPQGRGGAEKRRELPRARRLEDRHMTTGSERSGHAGAPGR